VSNTDRFNRAKWRLKVRRELEAIGATISHLCTGAWRVEKGDAHFVLLDLADLRRSDMEYLGSQPAAAKRKHVDLACEGVS
jgi:hypothetical protein